MSIPIDMPDVLLQTPAGGFIVGVNVVGDTIDAPVPQIWIPVRSAGLAAISIRRGHPNKGLSGYGPGTATLTFVDRDGSLNYPGNPMVVPGIPLKIVNPSDGDAIFTGTSADITFDYSPETGETVMTIHCVDHMATLENHTLYGMRPPSGNPWVAGSETFEARIQRISSRTPVTFAAIPGRPTALAGLELDGFTGVNQTPYPLNIGFDATSDTGFAGYIKTVSGTGTGAPGGLVGWQFHVAGLVVKRYILQADLIRPAGSSGWWYGEVRAGGVVTGHSTISTWEAPEGGFQRGTIQFEFLGHWNPDTCIVRFMAEADRTAHPSTMTSLTVEKLTIHDATSAGLFLSATVYETSAAQHLTMAADTVGGYWYVDRNNRVRVTWGDSPRPVTEYWFNHFIEPEWNPTDIPYGDLITTYSTADITNRINFTNHSMYPDASAIDPGQARDTTHEYADIASTIKNLPREVTLDVNAFTTDDADLPAVLERRAAEILGTRSTIQYLPSSLRFRAHEHATKATRLDLTQIISIITPTAVHTARVIGIDHDITPYEWLCTLELEPARN